MTLDQLRQFKSILILGYGREGRVTEKFLRAHVPGVTIDHADREDGPDYLNRQDHYDLVIKTPGIPKSLVRRPFTTATNIFLENLSVFSPDATAIGVTGTKGKSTTASLIHHVLKTAGFPAQLAGNIGTPMLSKLMSPLGSGAIFVLELSSYMLETLSKAPRMVVFINLFPEHLDYHGTYEAYKSAKAQITRNQQSNDYFFYNPDDPEVAKLADQTRATPMPFVAQLPFTQEQIRLFPLKGEHFLLDMRAAYTVAKQFAIEDKVIRRALRAFQPLAHRLQFVGEIRGIAFYDDAIATAPEPTIYAITTLGNVETIFLGGTDRGLHFEQLAATVCASPIRNIVLFPDTGKKIMRAIRAVCSRKFAVFETTNMRDAVAFAYEHTQPGKACLLSCASPSYSLWKDFEEKGDAFQRFVKELGAA